MVIRRAIRLLPQAFEGQQVIISLRWSREQMSEAPMSESSKRHGWNPQEHREALADTTLSPKSTSSAIHVPSLWPGTLISATAKSQPWIWAWNPDQDFPVFSIDAHLEMHAHHSTSGGFGNFYVDVARAVNTASGRVSLPPIRPYVARLDTSEAPAGLWAAFLAIVLSPALHFHALLMGIALFVLFPAGILAMRSGVKEAFRYHWILQVAGSTSISYGMITGLLMRWKINSVHQSIGIGIAVATGLQGILGWRHHVMVMESGHGTWVSDAHVLLGRLVMIAGWSNMVTGMMLYGYSIDPMVIVGALGLVEMAGISLWIWRNSSKEDVVQHGSEGSSQSTGYARLEGCTT